jgi:hypothetical protein
MLTTNNMIQAEVATNLKESRFFHGCKNEQDLSDISSRGFRSDFTDEEGRWIRDGNLGKGLYLTCDWRTAVWFGPVLLEATLIQGTRLLDVSLPADENVLDSLKREFGKELLVSGDIRKTLPRNKQLKLNELIELTRYFYHRVWSQDWSLEKSWKFSPHQKRDFRALEHAVSYLKRYKFDGYGHPQDDNGIVIFAADRIKLVKVVRALNFKSHSKLLDGKHESNPLSRMTLLEFSELLKVKKIIT